jgi:PAS domain S-box-containing protein
VVAVTHDDDSDPLAATAAIVRRDTDRILSEIAGGVDRTDPFAAAVRATRMPMIITDPRQHDNPILFVNDAFCRLTGYDRSEIVGRNCRFLQGPDTNREDVARIRLAIAARQKIEIAIYNYRKDGTPFWNQLLLAPVNDARGEVAYFFASQYDVTADFAQLSRLKGENAVLAAKHAASAERLQFSELVLHMATAAAEIGVWDYDLMTNTLTWSDRTREMFGLSPGERVTIDVFFAGLHPDDSAGTRAALEAAFDPVRRASYDVEYRTIGPHDGRVRWIAAKGRALFDEGFRCIRAVGTVIDITARKETEERLRRSEAELRELNANLEARVQERTAERDRAWKHSRDLQAVLTVTGIIQASNDAWGRILDWRPEDLHGQCHSKVTHPDDHGILGEAFARSLAGGQPSYEVRCLHRDGTARWISWVIAPEGSAVYASGRDITAEKQAASDLAVVQEQLRQSQKLEAVGQLTGGVAHDFNNLLTVIRSSVELLQRPNLPEDRRLRYVCAIADTVTRATKLTGQLLAFARRQTLQPRVFDVVQDVGGLGGMLDTLTGSRIAVETRLSTEACYVDADPTQFDTALVNMAANARDAIDGEGTLTIAVAAVDGIPADRGEPAVSGPFVAVTVADTGSGIPEAHLTHIFEPFYTTKEVGQGTGLGLSQVFGFAKQSGGEVRVASEVGVGTTFVLYLPRVSQPAEAPIERAEPVVDGQGAVILVVEDNEEVGAFSTQALSELGYETVWARNAEAALDRLAEAEGGFDVVFSDVVMPGMDGIDLAREIGRRHPGLPVVLASGYSHVLAQKGTSGFQLIHKPYSIEELSRVLRKAAASQRRNGGRRSAEP